jgi:hypothetical protein
MIGPSIPSPAQMSSARMQSASDKIVEALIKSYPGAEDVWPIFTCTQEEAEKIATSFRDRHWGVEVKRAYPGNDLMWTIHVFNPNNKNKAPDDEEG